MTGADAGRYLRRVLLERVSRLFLASPERMLRQVLGDPASE